MSDLLAARDSNSLEARLLAMERRLARLEQRPVRMNALDEISDDLGDQRAGRFLALASGSEPTDADATGAFMAAEPEVFSDGSEVNIGTVKNGVPSAGFNTAGDFFAALGRLLANTDGLLMTGQYYPIKFTATEGTDTREAWLGMRTPDGATAPVWSLMFTQPAGTELIANGGFETGDGTGWVLSGVTISGSGAHSGTYRADGGTSFSLTTYPRPTVTAGSTYRCAMYVENRNVGAGSVVIYARWYTSGETLLRTDTIGTVYANISTDWTVKEKVLVAPTGAGLVEFYVSGTHNFSGFSFDDFSISQVATSYEFRMTPTGAYINDYRPALVWDTTYLLPRRTSWLFGDMIGGALDLMMDTAQALAVYWMYSLDVNGTEWTQSVWLDSGSYTISILGQTHNGHAKLDIYIDGTAKVIGQDWYSATQVRNVVKTGSLTISAPGYHIIKFKINGRNSSNTSGYRLRLTRINIYPSSD